MFTALFADDGNHPSEGGTYLESLVVASTISGAQILSGTVLKAAANMPTEPRRLALYAML